MSKNLNSLEPIGLRESLRNLMCNESGSAPVRGLCRKYIAKLDAGEHEECLVESVIEELMNTDLSENSKSVLESLNESVKENVHNIGILKSVRNLEAKQSYIVPMISESLTNYLTDKTDANRSNVVNNLSLFESISDVGEILKHLSQEEYDAKSGRAITNVPVLESVKDVAQKTYTQKEVDEMVAEAVKNKPEESVREKKVVESIETGIELRKTLTNILRNTTNTDVKSLCEGYLKELNAGRPETLLYEAVVSSISRWNVLPAVDTELSALGNRIDKYRQNIDLRKILETMRETTSYYIVPLIEDLVAEYCENKNVNNRVVLRNRLQAFESDAYVRDIINVIEHDDSISNNVVLGESVETLNPYVKTEKTYSPVKYINENESVFNVHGTYFIKKGNNISRLTGTQISELPARFRAVCEAVNSDGVVISEVENKIYVYDGKDKAVISESVISVNNEELTVDGLNRAAEMSKMMYESRSAFYDKVILLNEEFNVIAPINFVKHVDSLTESGKSADVFRIDNSISINLSDKTTASATFYNNVNPMQCRTFLNEHMGINVAPLFEDILPGQKTILEGIENTKKEFEEYLSELGSSRENLEGMKTDNPESTEEIDAAIAAIDDEIASVKSKYSQYSDDSDAFVGKAEPDVEVKYSEDIVKSDEDERKETPEEMERPLDEVPHEPEIKSFGEFDTPVLSNGEYSFKVLRVNYKENLKTGKVDSRGEVFIMIPSVDSNGDIHSETKLVSFYLSPERIPIINNDFMPADMYLAIRDAILADPLTNSIEISAKPANADMPIIIVDDPEESETPVETVSEPIESPSDFSDDSQNELPSEQSEVIPGVLAEPSMPMDIVPDESESDNVNSVESEPIEPEHIDVENTETISAEEPAERQSPAEAEEMMDNPMYPISLDVNPEDIKPITKDEFENGLDDMGIEHSESESDAGATCLTLKDKSQVYGLAKYFKEWKNYNNAQFCTFFPELEKYFHNNGDIPVQPTNESVQINSIRKDVNESYVFPYRDEYASIFGISENVKDEKPTHIKVSFSSDKELCEAYGDLEKLNSIFNLDYDVKEFLAANREKYNRLTEVKTVMMCFPYNSIMEQVCTAKGIISSRDRANNTITIPAISKDFNKIVRMFEGYYGSNMPKNVITELSVAAKKLNEGLKISVTDEKTGKTITIYNSDEPEKNSENESKEVGLPDFSSSFNNDVTFNEEDTMLYKDDEKDDEKDKNSGKKDESDEKVSDNESEKDENDKKVPSEGSDNEETDEEKSPEEKSDDEEEKSKEDKPKKKFVFKKREKNESVKSAVKTGMLNESAKPTVYDNVIIRNGKKAQIMYQMMNGNFIVLAEGRTIEVSPSEVKMATERPDTVECPYRFDKDTLKGLFEQMVPCGMFMNGVQVTPSDCYIKLSEYLNSPMDSEVCLVVEGESSMVKREYIRLTESLDSVLDIMGYVDGFIVKEGIETDSVLINNHDFNRYLNESTETNQVRTVVKGEDGTSKMVYMPGAMLKIK